MNECEAQRCSQECANIYGSYQCYCRHGYQLAEDGHTCTGASPGPPGAPAWRHLPRASGSRVPAGVGGHTGLTEASAPERRPLPSHVAPGHLDKCFPGLTSGTFPAKQRRWS